MERKYRTLLLALMCMVILLPRCMANGDNMMATFFERPGSEGEFIGIPMKDKDSWETLRNLVGTLDPGRTLSPMLEEKLRGGEVVGLISAGMREPKKVQRNVRIDGLSGRPRGFPRSVDANEVVAVQKSDVNPPPAKDTPSAPVVLQRPQPLQTKTSPIVAVPRAAQHSTSTQKPAEPSAALNVQPPKTAVNDVTSNAKAPEEPVSVAKVRQPKSSDSKHSDLVTLNLAPLLKALSEKEIQIDSSAPEEAHQTDPQELQKADEDEESGGSKADQRDEEVPVTEVKKGQQALSPGKKVIARKSKEENSGAANPSAVPVQHFQKSFDDKNLGFGNIMNTLEGLLNTIGAYQQSEKGPNCHFLSSTTTDSQSNSTTDSPTVSSTSNAETDETLDVDEGENVDELRGGSSSCSFAKSFNNNNHSNNIHINITINLGFPEQNDSKGSGGGRGGGGGTTTSKAKVRQIWRTLRSIVQDGIGKVDSSMDSGTEQRNIPAMTVQVNTGAP